MKNEVRAEIEKIVQIAATEGQDLNGKALATLESNSGIVNPILDGIKLSSLIVYFRQVIRAKVWKEVDGIPVATEEEIAESFSGYVHTSTSNGCDSRLTTSETANYTTVDSLLEYQSDIEFASNVEAEPLTDEEILEEAEEDAIMAKANAFDDLSERVCKIEELLANMGLSIQLFTVEK